jgi:autotransporter-associated beta strand protein
MALAIGVVDMAHAQNTWNWIRTVTSSAQAWGTSSYWDPASVPSEAGAVVNFTADIQAGQAINLASSRTLGTLNLGLPGNLNRYSFGNTSNGLNFRANADDTLGTATININNDVAEVDGHTIQGTVQMRVENVVINNNAAGGRLNFSRWLIDGDGDADRSPTMTLNAVAGSGVLQFGIPSGDTTNRNEWGKLIVNEHATFRNSNPNNTAGAVDDRALGKALDSYLADAITLNGGTLQGPNASLNYSISPERGITLGSLGGTFNRSWTVNSIITGSGGLSQTLGGTVTLNGDNTYLGPTTVTDGTLAINGNQSLAIGTVTVGTDPLVAATLAGTGTTGGDVTFASGSKILFGQTDLTVGGTISFGGSFGIADIVGLDATAIDGTYQLLTGSINSANLLNVGEANAFDLGGGKEAYFTTDSGLGVSVVPEPAASLAIATGLAAAVCWLRARRPRAD